MCYLTVVGSGKAIDFFNLGASGLPWIIGIGTIIDYVTTISNTFSGLSLSLLVTQVHTSPKIDLNDQVLYFIS